MPIADSFIFLASRLSFGPMNLPLGATLDLALLWFLIAYFKTSLCDEDSYGEAWLVLMGTKLPGLASAWLFPGEFAGFQYVVQLLSMYVIIHYICGKDLATSLRICRWYLLFGAAVQASVFMLRRMLLTA